MTLEERVGDIIEEVRAEFAPDPRLSVFDVGVEEDGRTLRLVGETSEPAAAEQLHRRLAVLDGSVAVEDLITRLPDGSEPERAHALVSTAVAPIMAGPLVAEVQLSQALLGQRLLILRREGRWLHCRAEDGYLGWIHRGYVERLDESAARAWEMGTGGAACLSLGATAVDRDGDVIARLPWGARVIRSADGSILLPDGTVARVAGDLLPMTEQAERFPPTGRAIVATAHLWLGAPYIWGGTTPAGVDCSGLVQAVFRTHGVVLPRDSDQQAGIGTAVDPGEDFSALLPGDLLFFAEIPDRVTHVTLSTGGSGIIHSSLGNGGVQRNDLAGSLHYEEELRDLFVGARRVLSEG